MNISTINKFVTTYKNCDLFDLESAGPRYTWSRHVGGRVVARRKLDRVLWNMEAQLEWPGAKTFVFLRLQSDHHPILFMSSAGETPSRNNRPFIFEAAWLTREDYAAIWSTSWHNKEYNFVQGIEEVTRRSKQWNTEKIGNIFRNKRLLEARI